MYGKDSRGVLARYRSLLKTISSPWNRTSSAYALSFLCTKMVLVESVMTILPKRDMR